MGAVARRIGSGGTIAVYAAVVVALIVGFRGFGGSDVTGALAASLGGLHLLFGGFIWRSPRRDANEAAVGTKTSAEDLRQRRPSVGAGLGAVPVAT